MHANNSKEEPEQTDGLERERQAEDDEAPSGVEVARETGEALEDDGDHVDAVQSEAEELVVCAGGGGSGQRGWAPLTWEDGLPVVVGVISQEHAEFDGLASRRGIEAYEPRHIGTTCNTCEAGGS